MSASATWASDIIGFIDDRRPDVVPLAILASVAVRIEPHLLRRLRVALLPEADVGVEADLWFSPLVESRGADAIVLHTAVARELWIQLAAHPRRDEAIGITLDAHAAAAPALVLEEQLTALAITDEVAALARTEVMLEPVMAALREGDARAREVARWLHRASRRLPDVLLASDSLRLLFAVSAIMLERPRLTPHTPDLDSLTPAQLASAAELLPRSILSNTVTLGIAFDGERLEFIDPADTPHTIRLPDTTPRLLAVSWGEGADPSHHVIDPTAGYALPLRGPYATVLLTTLAGDVWEVTRVQDSEPVNFAKAELYARLLWLLQVPMARLVTTLSAPQRNLVTVLTVAARQRSRVTSRQAAVEPLG